MIEFEYSGDRYVWYVAISVVLSIIATIIMFRVVRGEIFNCGYHVLMGIVAYAIYYAASNFCGLVFISGSDYLWMSLPAFLIFITSPIIYSIFGKKD